MAGYRICREKTAISPFYIECIGTSIYSMEELCFFFQEYMPLIDASVMNPALVRWVSIELGDEKTAAAMGEALRSGCDFAGVVLPVFESIGWMSGSEREAFRRRLEEFFAKTTSERLKMKGDALVRRGLFVAAIKNYRKIIEEGARLQYSESFLAKVWYNKGVAEMKMMLYDEAISSFKMAEELEATPFHTRALLLSIGLSKPKAKYEEALLEMKPEEAVQKEAGELLDVVRGDALTVVLPEDIHAFVEEKVKEYHAATGA